MVLMGVGIKMFCRSTIWACGSSVAELKLNLSLRKNMFRFLWVSGECSSGSFTVLSQEKFRRKKVRSNWLFSWVQKRVVLVNFSPWALWIKVNQVENWSKKPQRPADFFLHLSLSRGKRRRFLAEFMRFISSLKVLLVPPIFFYLAFILFD